ncbi:MAG: sulfite dehydrogenase [SAR86 cluster bacterium]|uniref:Sulfite dehydrogenase n=1 Tax=SAR86 cluster bacterium TaxID=2030880 RepID=A0A2A5C7C4_9GAMM|nr:sulfite dehydrogenase [Gammaproteobacteria bacterium AH-315-E17]PCJ39371.1 MAG: sulfite dehydrogenase [SAR86 cluster bacterium]
MKKTSVDDSNLEVVAGNGLMHRRLFLTQSAAMAGGLGLLSAQAAVSTPLEIPPWMKAPGTHMSPYGQPSQYEQGVQRIVGGAPGVVGSGVSFTPLEQLHGTITPNSLHFERHHSGVPNIDPDAHTFLIHGMVERPLTFTMDALMRYPTVTRIQFLECAGNSGGNLAPTARQAPLGVLHGLMSCSEWTGVPLSILLDEAGVDPSASWALAEGADAAAMTRSIPLEKMMDDAIVALYQNGERLRPENGYPMRLFLPGYEGNMSVKWLRRLKLTSAPTMTRDETSHYTDVLLGGKARLLTYPMGVKSIITSPSVGLNLNGPGLYEVTGIAWSGAGKISRVEVSADGGNTWAEAALTDPVLSKSFTRFRMAWRWNGGPAILKSRAIDETGAVQPTRAALISEYGERPNYHNNAIQTWGIAENSGEVSNVYA